MGLLALLLRLAGDDAGLVNLDRSGMQSLSRTDCLRLLASVRVGRVGFHSGALPVILPVVFALDDHGVVVRVRAGSQLDQGTRAAVVAFEADEAYGSDRIAWSVSVTGVANDILDPADLEHARGLALDDGPQAGSERFVRITLDLISGRRECLAGAATAPAARTTA